MAGTQDDPAGPNGVSHRGPPTRMAAYTDHQTSVSTTGSTHRRAARWAGCRAARWAGCRAARWADWRTSHLVGRRAAFRTNRQSVHGTDIRAARLAGLRPNLWSGRTVLRRANRN